jgi:hypothetical protein
VISDTCDLLPARLQAQQLFVLEDPVTSRVHRVGEIEHHAGVPELEARLLALERAIEGGMKCRKKPELRVSKSRL